MANWTWAVTPTLQGIQGSYASLNGQQKYYRDPVSRNVFATIICTSDDQPPQTYSPPNAIFGVDLPAQAIANFGYGVCNSLSLGDTALAALSAADPTPDTFPPPDASVGASAQAQALFMQTASTLAALQAYVTAGVITNADPNYAAIVAAAQPVLAAVAANVTALQTAQVGIANSLAPAQGAQPAKVG